MLPLKLLIKIIQLARNNAGNPVSTDASGAAGRSSASTAYGAGLTGASLNDPGHCSAFNYAAGAGNYDAS